MPSKNTKKKIKQGAKSTNHKEEVVEQVAVTPVETTEPAKAEVEKTEVAPVEVKEDTSKDAKKDKKKKEKKPSKIKAKSKEVFSELKKVTWPTFPQIVKKTATVLVVVAIFAVVLLGIDKLLQVVYDLFIGNLK